MTRDDAAWLENAFTHHPPRDQTDVLRYQEIRQAGKEFAELLLNETPDSPERSTALRKIREAVMWANAALACAQDAPKEM